jgi:hypothetical protein
MDRESLAAMITRVKPGQSCVQFAASPQCQEALNDRSCVASVAVWQQIVYHLHETFGYARISHDFVRGSAEEAERTDNGSVEMRVHKLYLPRPGHIK